MFTLDETATIWLVTTNSYGQRSFARHEIPAKHAQKQSLFIDRNGNQVLSQAAIYFKSELPQLGTFVVFGVDASTLPPESAYEIKAFVEVPSETTLKKAML